MIEVGNTIKWREGRTGRCLESLVMSLEYDLSGQPEVIRVRRYWANLGEYEDGFPVFPEEVIRVLQRVDAGPRTL